MQQDYPWAQNKIKLQLSVNALHGLKKIKPEIVIDEASIKAEYIKRAGHVLPTVEIMDQPPIISDEIVAVTPANLPPVISDVVVSSISPKKPQKPRKNAKASSVSAE